MGADNVLLFPGRRRKPAVAGRRMRTDWPAEIKFHDSALRCTVADISPEGAKLQSLTLPEAGSRVWLSLDSTPLIAAEVAWRRHAHIGLRFIAEQRWVAHLQARCPFAWSR